MAKSDDSRSDAGGNNQRPGQTDAFARRARIAASIAISLMALALFLWKSLRVLLLAFAAVLVGVLLRGLSGWVARRCKLPMGWALIIVVLGLLGLFALLGIFAAPSIVQQAEDLADRLPKAVQKAEERFRQYSWGRRILGDRSDDPASTRPGRQDTAPETAIDATTAVVKKHAGEWTQKFLQLLAEFVGVMVVGTYLAAQPRFYVGGFLKLFPKKRRPRLREVMERIGYTLRWWMTGQLIPMAVIGTITAVGLKIIGVELWLTLGLLAALFNFIPNIGPLISGVPAVLIALSDPEHGLQKAGWVIALYIVAQNLEGYVLTPLVQRKAVALPPALTILSQVLAYYLMGGLGVLLAAPLLAATVVAVKMLYVEDMLGDTVEVPGDSS